MAWLDIRGHKKAIGFLLEAAKKDRLAQSYLFLGPQGVGKKLVAIEFAKFLFCRQVKPEGACGKCADCIKVAFQTHPDLHIFSKGAFDIIKIEEMRRLQNEMSLKAFSAKYKIAIIDNAQMLNVEAANSLLKLMEEPSLKSIIILITTRIDSLPETITSRCQRLYFSPLSNQDVVEELVKIKNIDNEQMHFLSRFSEGRLGRALYLADNKNAFSDKNKLFYNLLSKPEFGFNDFAADLNKENIALSLEFMLFFFRDLLVFKSGLDKSFLINSDEAEPLFALSQRLEVVDIEEALDDILKAQEMNKTNVNPKILLTWLAGQLKMRIRQ